MSVKIITGHVLEVLRAMPPESVHTVVTSPPYWGLRDYGIEPQVWGGEASCEHAWGEELLRGGPAGAQGSSSQRAGRSSAAIQGRSADRLGAWCQRCGAWRGSLGLEPTPQLFVEHLVEVFREVRRVLRSDGTVWLNLGDSYVSAPNGGHGYDTSTLTKPKDGSTRAGHMANPPGLTKGRTFGGLKPKDLVMVPARSALALQADGWWVRQDIIWSKPNPMPESVTDRCTKSHEYLFLLSKSERYYFDAEAIKEPSSEGTHERRSKYKTGVKPVAGWATGSRSHHVIEHNKQKNTGRKLADEGYGIKNNKSFDEAMAVMPSTRNKRSVWTVTTQPFKEAHFATFPPALIEPCILAGCPKGGTVLDPFGGAGTTGLVADRHGRDAVLVELSPAYAKMAEERIRQDGPLFAQVAPGKSALTEAEPGITVAPTP